MFTSIFLIFDNILDVENPNAPPLGVSGTLEENTYHFEVLLLFLSLKRAGRLLMPFLAVVITAAFLKRC